MGSNFIKVEVESLLYGDGVPERISCRVATIAAGTLASDFENGDTIDSVVLATGDRILIKDQASGVENGIYIVQATGAPVRADDLTDGATASYKSTSIREGATHAGTTWRFANLPGSDTVGTDALTFQKTAAILPAGSSTDNAIVRFDGNTSSAMQDSGVLIDDSDNMSGLGYIELTDIDAPANPGAGLGRLYKKTGNDGIFWLPDGAGAEVDLTGGGGGGGGGGLSTVETFTSSDTFVVPAGVSVMLAYCQGGGGGGGGGGVGSQPGGAYPGNPIYNGTGGGGGGSGTYKEFVFDVTAGDVLDITVGSGGSGGIGADFGFGGTDPATAGADGGDTTITRSGVDLARAHGGKGGGFGNGPGTPYEVGGNGGAGDYGGGGGGGGSLAGTGGIGLVKDGSNADGLIGGDGAPGNIVGYDAISGGGGAVPPGPDSGNPNNNGYLQGAGGGGGCPTTVPLLGGIGLTGKGGDGGESYFVNGRDGDDATRYGAGGGGGGGSGLSRDGGDGGNGRSGYVVLVY